ncbi:response regulator [Pseudomonas alloputida]|uniref:response regulator n=1 Tax=Pseudomonas alloputida TaxID=1940621 RepID=UPI00386EC50A
MPKSILIVEDDDLLRDLTAEGLSSLYAVNIVACANADEALDHLSHYKTPTLVVTDIHMPGHLDGIALAQEIWRRWPTLPVILTSGDVVIDASQLPIHHTFLPKPWGIPDLATMIGKITTLTRQGGW